MKFLSVALVAAFAGMAEGKRTISSSQIKTRLANGEFNKETLMRGAKPYGATARKLEEEEEWEINGMYSIQFNSCWSMKVQSDDLFEDEQLMAYAQDGAIVPEKSYILFSACAGNECYYQSEDAKLTFITDIATFFQAFYDFLPNQVEDYCDACQQNYDYCSGELQYEYEQQQAEEAEQEAADEDAEEDAEDGAEEGADEDADEDAQDDADAAEEGEDGERKARKLANGKTVEFINCDKCDAYECFAEEQEAGDDDAVVYEFEDALQWLEQLSQCQQMEEVYYDGMEIFAGLVCNEAGDGIEIGVFFDDECTLFSPKISYASQMTYADQQYYSLSEEVVEYMFTNSFSCYQPEIEYTNEYQYEADEEDDADQDDEYEVPEAAEWCQDLFGGEMEPVNMYDCGVDADAEQEDEQNDEYDQNLVYYGEWYSYELSEEQVDDSSEVCEVVKSLEGEHYTVYDQQTGGSLYTYNTKSSSGSSDGMGAGPVFVILLVIAAAAGAAVFVFKKQKNEKKDPLISSADGTMA